MLLLFSSTVYDHYDIYLQTKPEWDIWIYGWCTCIYFQFRIWLIYRHRHNTFHRRLPNFIQTEPHVTELWRHFVFKMAAIEPQIYFRLRV